MSGKTAFHSMDFYAELFPVAAALIIGSGLVSLSMGDLTNGGVCVVTGIGLGVIGALNKGPVVRRTQRRA